MSDIIKDCIICGKPFHSYKGVQKVCKKEQCRIEKKKLDRLSTREWQRKYREKKGIKKKKRYNKNKVIDDYKNNIPLKEIMENNNIKTPNTIYEILKRSNILPNRVSNDSDFLNLPFILGGKNSTDSNGKKRTMYLARCYMCGREKYITTTQIKNFLKTKKSENEYTCFSCNNDYNLRTTRASKQVKRKDNTSGYIGVTAYTCRKGGDPIGWRAQLMHKGVIHRIATYKDEYLSKTVAEQASVDRDIYIIKNNLPHTRNHTDMELIGLIYKYNVMEKNEYFKILKNYNKGD